MKKLKLIKKVAGVVVSIGVGAIVNNVVKSTTPSTTSKIMKVCIMIGSFVLGGMISDKATEHAENMITKTAKDVKDALNEPEQV
jgi:hypothetical protein